MHYRKMSPHLYMYLEDKKYIKEDRISGWGKVDKKIAQIYMRTLAEFSIKCSSEDIVLGTDNISNNREIYGSCRKPNRT